MGVVDKNGSLDVFFATVDHPIDISFYTKDGLVIRSINMATSGIIVPEGTIEIHLYRE